MPGSLWVGTVTSRLGSGWRVLDPMSASKDSFHWSPKWMLWCSVPGAGLPFAPTCHTTADGEYVPFRTARGGATSGRSWS